MNNFLVSLSYSSILTQVLYLSMLSV